jgi:sec-independent protein translocase protein TatA
MGSFSIWHWLVVLLVILLLFGSGKISGLMGDLAKGIKSFKQNIKEGREGRLHGGAGQTPRSRPAPFPARSRARPPRPGAAANGQPPRRLTFRLPHLAVSAGPNVV